MTAKVQKQKIKKNYFFFYNVCLSVYMYVSCMRKKERESERENERVQHAKLPHMGMGLPSFRTLYSS